jgi:hypothetical protein
MTHRGLLLCGIAVLLIAVFAGFVVNDHASCARTNGTRLGLQTFFDGQVVRATKRSTIEHGAVRKIDISSITAAHEASQQEHQLDCSALLPGTR